MTGIKIEPKSDLNDAEKALAARFIVYSVTIDNNKMIDSKDGMTLYGGAREIFTVTETSHDGDGNVVENEETYHSILQLERDPAKDVFYVERKGGFRPW